MADAIYATGDRVRINALHFRADEVGTVTAVHDRPRTYKVAVALDSDPTGPYLFSYDELEAITDERQPEAA